MIASDVGGKLADLSQGHVVQETIDNEICMRLRVDGRSRPTQTPERTARSQAQMPCAPRRRVRPEAQMHCAP